MNSGLADRSLLFIHQMYTTIRQALSPLQLVLLQQLCFCMVFIVTNPVYKFTLDFDSLINVVEASKTQPVQLQDLKTLVDVLEKQLQLPQLLIFSNVMVLVIFMYTLSSMLGNGKSHRVTTQSNIVVFGIITWVLLCFHVFIPLRFSCSSGLQKGVMSFIQNPVTSLFVMLMFFSSFPFSMVADPPLKFGSKTLTIVNQKLARTIESKIILPPTINLANLFNVSYNWSVLLPLFMFIVSCIILILYTDFNEIAAGVDGSEEIAEILKIGNVRRLSKNFENKKKPPPVSEKPKIHKTPIVEEEVIKPVIATPLAQSKQKTPATLAKVRPVNVTKPLQLENIQDTSGSTVLGSPSQESLPDNIHHDNLGNVSNTKDSQKVAIEENEGKCVIKCEIGVQFRPSIVDNSSQTPIHESKDVQLQCEGVQTRTVGEQTHTVITSDKSVLCEILSQERYVKLQQSALALYKKTVEQKKYAYTSLPKKVHVSSNVTKFNKAVQASFKLPEEKNESAVNRHSKEIKDITEIKLDDCQSNKEIQTDLFGYVLDKIIQERETSNLYSKLDVERTVHSVLTLSEKIKQHTETIRFKAMKSQHGVWYVSLRGDIFLTISQDILKNVKLNAERKIETDVSSDILRAMKLFIDNYNKLSDCFDDDEESDDESFINGFRL